MIDCVFGAGMFIACVISIAIQCYIIYIMWGPPLPPKRCYNYKQEEFDIERFKYWFTNEPTTYEFRL